ncbi:unnamed protein product [Prunus brigantina]
MSVKPTRQRMWRSEKKEAHQMLAVDDKSSGDYNSSKRKDRETYPPLPCKDKEFHAILDTMFADGAIKPLRPYKVPTRKENGDPRYCSYDQYMREYLSSLLGSRQLMKTPVGVFLFQQPDEWAWSMSSHAPMTCSTMVNRATNGRTTQSHRRLFGNLAETWRRPTGVNIQNL